MIEDVSKKYSCSCTVKTAGKPSQPIEKSTAGASLLTQVRQMLTLCLTGYPWCAVFPLPNPGPKRVCRLHDPINAHLTRPIVANCIAGTVTGSGKPYLVFESVRPATRHSRYSTAHAPDDGTEGASIHGVNAGVRPGSEVGTPADVKTGETAVVLFRA